MEICDLNEDERKIFSILQKDGPMTKKSLLECTCYKTSTLNRIVEALIKKRAIVEFGQDDSSGGRRPSLFDVNINEKYLIGIEISRTYFCVVLCNLKIQIVEKDICYGDFEPKEEFELISECVSRLLAHNSISMNDILGAGLGIVGPVNRHTGCSGVVAGHLAKGWSNFPLQKFLQEKLKCPVYVDNGTCAAVLLEYLCGEGNEYERVSYFNCGIGIRSSHINSGSIIRAANNEEDAFSHMTISALFGEPCKCGKKGCVGLYASTRAITNNIIRRLKAGERSLIDVPEKDINYLHYISAAKQGDKIVIEELEHAGICFGIGLANYITLLNTELVIIGGPLATETSIFFDAAVDFAEKNIYRNDVCNVKFKRGGLYGQATVAAGAALMFLERHIKNPIMD